MFLKYCRPTMKIFACVAVVISVEVLGVLGGSGKNRHLSSPIYFTVNILLRLLPKLNCWRLKCHYNLHFLDLNPSMFLKNKFQFSGNFRNYTSTKHILCSHSTNNPILEKHCKLFYSSKELKQRNSTWCDIIL